MEKKALIIYHSEDNDGLFSMAIVYWWLRDKKGFSPKDIKIYGTNYNQLSDLVKSGKIDMIKSDFTTLAITDVSFNEHDVMLDMYKAFGDKFYWFDHHKPIIDFSMTNDLHKAQGLRDTGHSALYNAWKYCHTDIEVPDYFEILSAYDSFSFDAAGIDKEYATNVNQGTTNKFRLDVKSIINVVKGISSNYISHNSLMNENDIIDETFEIGKAFNEEQDGIHERLIKEYGDDTWTVDGRKACAVVVQEQTSSDFFKSVKDTDIQNGIIFKRQKNGNWVISLYNVNTDDHSFHCGDYMKTHYTGGGHEGAAGCTVTLDQCYEIMKNKKL